MSGATATIAISRAPSPEDQARADCYAVLARLFADAPDRAFLDALGSAARQPEDQGVPLAGAWNRLLDASRAMDADAARQEYDDLFVGVGKSEVSLHGSYWCPDAQAEKPLVTLRSDLAALGLARRGDAAMFEDHLAALCEAMRLLITGDVERSCASIDVQRNFLQKHLLSWVFECCAAIEQCSLANYYRRVAEFGCVFMTVERDSVDMD